MGKVGLKRKKLQKENSQNEDVIKGLQMEGEKRREKSRWLLA